MDATERGQAGSQEPTGREGDGVQEQVAWHGDTSPAQVGRKSTVNWQQPGWIEGGLMRIF